MAEPTLDQRTPNLRLKYESNDTRNYNWEKIDEKVGEMMQALAAAPPVITPGSVTTDMLAIGSTVAAFTNSMIAGDQFCLLTTPKTLVSVTTLAGTRGGPLRITGTLPLIVINVAAATTQVAFDVTLSVGGTQVLLASFTNYNIVQNASTILVVPLLYSQPVIALPISVIVTKQVGADANISMKTQGGGSIQVSELA